ncbi:hypothetical protein [Thermocrinis sp.]|jgi:hypothetical protein|uniref:hypothetical protein n=1 Tax=Thermocrinis sp. TaxID=2024383 RepID=UPI003BFF4A9C
MLNPHVPRQGSRLPYNIILAMTEKRPAAKNQPPKQKQTQEKKDHPIKLFEGKRIVVKEIGPNTIEGDCIVAEPGYLILMNVVIKGTKHVAEAQLLYIPHHRISFAHTVPTKVEKIEEEETQ